MEAVSNLTSLQTVLYTQLITRVNYQVLTLFSGGPITFTNPRKSIIYFFLLSLKP